MSLVGGILFLSGVICAFVPTEIAKEEVAVSAIGGGIGLLMLLIPFGISFVGQRKKRKNQVARDAEFQEFLGGTNPFTQDAVRHAKATDFLESVKTQRDEKSLEQKIKERRERSAQKEDAVTVFPGDKRIDLLNENFSIEQVAEVVRIETDKAKLSWIPIYPRSDGGYWLREGWKLERYEKNTQGNFHYRTTTTGPVYWNDPRDPIMVSLTEAPTVVAPSPSLVVDGG